MRTKTILVSERNLMFVIAGQLFEQAPNRQPRKAEIIMQKVRDKLRSDECCINDNEFYSIRIEEEKFYDFLKELLFSIPEFVELNLSHVEYEKGVSVDDENRTKFAFTSRYDKYDSESWKTDFIDLDAFVRNVERAFWLMHDSEFDCFMCVNQPADVKSTLDCGNSEKCKNCSVNPNLKNNYEGIRHPKGKYTFACKYDCYKHKYICCEECEENDICQHSCDSKSDECGLAINYKVILNREKGDDLSIK